MTEHDLLVQKVNDILRRPESMYFGVLPITVRHDKRLSVQARLLYCELVSRCIRLPYCIDDDAKLADVLNVTEEEISEWLTELRLNGNIKVIEIYNSNHILLERRIHSVVTPEQAAKEGL